MFADPMAVTFDGAATNIPKVNQDGFASQYFLKRANDSLTVNIRHSSTTDKATGRKRSRHNVEFIQVVFATTTVPEMVYKSYTVFEHDDAAAAAVIEDTVLTMAAFLTSANIARLINKES